MERGCEARNFALEGVAGTQQNYSRSHIYMESFKMLESSATVHGPKGLEFNPTTLHISCSSLQTSCNLDAGADMHNIHNSGRGGGRVQHE